MKATTAHLGLIITAVLSIASALHAADSSAKPNIVLIISDDHRWDAIGAAGNKAIHTPNIDRLAREGTYFVQGTINVPQCSPARASLLTGLPPHQNGHLSNQSQRADVKNPDGFKQYPMLPALLHSGGYRTVFVGKWHIAAEPWNCGFSDVRVWMPGGSGPYLDATKLAKGNSREPAGIKGFTNEVFGTDAAEFINSDASKEKPFFLWLALTAPHTPLTPNPPEIQKLYQGKSDDELWPPALSKKAQPSRLRAYYEAVTMADRQVGHVLEALDKQELLKSTIVIFIGDNGWMMGDRDLPIARNYNGKAYPYDDSIRIPFIVRVPGQSSVTSEAAVSSLDLPPTILKMAGVAPPAAWSGRDLQPALSGETTGFDAAICELPDSENAKFGDINYRLARTTTHKLIVWANPQRPDEFYDLKADPHETKNLIAESSSAAGIDQLRAKLHAWMKKTDDPALKWKPKTPPGSSASSDAGE